jgi:streptogramin lyase
MMRFTLLLFSGIACMLMPIGRTGTGVAVGVTPSPTLDAPIVATLVGGELSLSGQNLGSAGTPRSITFSYEGQLTIVDADAPEVASWDETSIELTLPMSVRPGTLMVTVNGVTSAPIDLLVFLYSRVPLPDSPGTDERPLTLDIGQDGVVWVLEEYHTQLKSVAAGVPPKAAAITIPQAPGGIFAQNLNGDSPSAISALGEDVDVASDGSIWFTQGGQSHYAGAFANTSRIVRYQPSTRVFSCFPAPVDNAAVFGLALDEVRGMVWYAESAFANGNAITGFDPDEALNNCSWTPNMVRPVVCGEVPSPGCHTRFPLPQASRRPSQMLLAEDGQIWFTQLWGNGLGVLDPDSGTFTNMPFKAARVQTEPVFWAGSGPWEIAAGEGGDLWVTEFFDAALVRVRRSLMATEDCTQLDAAGENPCVEEIVAASNGLDGKSMHSVAPASAGRVWFGLSDSQSSIGFVSTQHNNEVVYLPTLTATTTIGGLDEDSLTGDIWFTQFYDASLGRLHLATGDGDGIPDALDNCPDAFNPGQENADRNFVDLSPWNKPFNDMTWPASDNIGDACDDDADNDGLSNEAEANPAAYGCPSASAPLDPLVRDTDADLVLDGAECILGSDPASPASLPVPPAPATDPDRDGLSTATELLIGTDPLKRDTDGDRIDDGAEFRSYGSDPLSPNGDGDTCGDVYEAASLNGDSAVNSIDMLILATSFGPQSSPKYVPQFDVNRDRSINSGDLGTAAAVFGPCRTN